MDGLPCFNTSSGRTELLFVSRLLRYTDQIPAQSSIVIFEAFGVEPHIIDSLIDSPPKPKFRHGTRDHQMLAQVFQPVDFRVPCIVCHWSQRSSSKSASILKLTSSSLPGCGADPKVSLVTNKVRERSFKATGHGAHKDMPCLPILGHKVRECGRRHERAWLKKVEISSEKCIFVNRETSIFLEVRERDNVAPVRGRVRNDGTAGGTILDIYH